ncbi:MAG: BLUF domain-containing protein [Oceanicaulis sp.]
MSDLSRLLYVSRPRIDVTDQDEIGRLMSQCAVNNRRRAITGLLAMNRSAFVQLLEGPHAALQALSTRLAADRRHSDFKILAFKRAAARVFPAWSMALPSTASQAASPLADYDTLAASSSDVVLKQISAYQAHLELSQPSAEERLRA